MNRTAATESDITVGALVYKGNGKAAWKVTGSMILAPAFGGKMMVAIVKDGCPTRRIVCDQPLSSLTVEVA